MKNIYITGPNGAGKSTISERLSKKLGIPGFETDDVYTPLLKKYNKPINYPEFLTDKIRSEISDGFRKMLNGRKEFVINGFALNYKEIRDVIREISGNDYILFNIVPNFEGWKSRMERRVIEHPDTTISRHATWKTYAGHLSRFEPPAGHYYTVEDSNVLDASMINYQIPKLLELKFKGLPMERVGGRVLDLGCAEGYMGKLLLESKQATEVVGMDHSWWYLEKAKEFGNKPVLADLNTVRILEYGEFDFILCLSVLHRVMDKERLIWQISLATKEAIFELPLCLDKGLVTRRYDDIEGHTKKETQAWPPSRSILELWFAKYFSGFELVGNSPLKYGDDSWRVVYRCWK